MRVLITDISTKHSVALQRELSQYDNLYLIGYSESYRIYAKLYGYCKEYCGGDLVGVVKKYKPDIIIPVGGASVRLCSEYFRDLTLLPSKEILDIAFNKDRLVELNSIQGVNYPEVITFKATSELLRFCAESSIVVKSNNEAKSKFDPLYIEPGFCENHNNLKVIDDLLKSGVELLAQRKVQGVGRGFFCIAKNGIIYTYYMHERIREMPATGGSSTAAKSIYCPVLHSISENIVKYLNWSGPLMIEFKFDKSSYVYYLIELNPKFWGSLNLSYAVGLSFGRTLIDVYRSDRIEVKPCRYQVGIEFYWILEGDILNLIQTRNLRAVGQYFKSNARTSLFENIFVDFIRIIWNFKKLLKL
jgi:hypothetical protein